MKLVGMTVSDRFAAKQMKDPGSGCLIWTDRLSGGYGYFRTTGKTVQAHRYAYEMAKGPIPAGLEIDHLCRNRSCVNPAHLEAVTPRENVRRSPRAQRQHCAAGHPYTMESTYFEAARPSTRQCRTCIRARKNAAKERN